MSLSKAIDNKGDMMIIGGDMNVGGISRNGYMGSPALPSWLMPPTSFQARTDLVSLVFGFSAAGNNND